jgi:hypothetical protein
LFAILPLAEAGLGFQALKQFINLLNKIELG